MTRAYVDDSHLFCPRLGCGKRLMVEVGQEENTGENQLWHVCWCCGYEERDRDWKTPRVRSRVVDFRALHERRKRLWDVA